ncbi:MAG TPA: N-acetyl-alpha-D-glucosaminyl L-malate synthase BshA [Polyangia bacterium]|nr:N-acetyl-alpha-D-glucosaminyl L-malate synthase BshA [Polyangia bacterium]
MNPLRVGVVCFSTFGGSGVIATEIAIDLARRGHAVHVFSDDLPGRMDARVQAAAAQLVFHRVSPPAYPQLKQSPYTLALTSKIVEVSRRERLDLVHAHYALPHAVAAHLARQVLVAEGGAPLAPRIVTTLHGTDITLVGTDPSFLPLTRFSIASSDAVTTPSRWLAGATHVALGVPDAIAIDVIPNFVDVDRFTPAADAERAGRGGGPPVIVHVSNFRPLKRLDDVVEVFAGVRAARPARLCLIGDGPERARIEAAIAARGLGADVELLGERADLPALLRGADVFLLPSEIESFGLAALEALACGVPVVASSVGGLPEVVTDGEVGFLRPVGDVAAMATAVARLLDDQPLRRRMGTAARRLVESRYALGPAVDRYLDVYLRVLSSPRPR